MRSAIGYVEWRPKRAGHRNNGEIFLLLCLFKLLPWTCRRQWGCRMSEKTEVLVCTAGEQKYYGTELERDADKLAPE